MPWPVVTLLARKPATRPTKSQTRIDSTVRLMAIAAQHDSRDYSARDYV